MHCCDCVAPFARRHFVDDNSWPVVFPTYPNFSTAGAYDPMAIYEPSDVKLVVQYAWERGVMVIPGACSALARDTSFGAFAATDGVNFTLWVLGWCCRCAPSLFLDGCSLLLQRAAVCDGVSSASAAEFDSPAHASIWGAGYPDLVISCANGQTLLNPTGPVYPVLDGLLAQYDDQFVYGFVHIGGDEVENYICWDESAEVQAFNKQMGFKNSSDTRSYYGAPCGPRCVPRVVRCCIIAVALLPVHVSQQLQRVRAVFCRGGGAESGVQAQRALDRVGGGV